MDDHAYRMALALRDRLRSELEQNQTYLALQHAEAIIRMHGSPDVGRLSAHTLSTATTGQGTRNPSARKGHLPNSHTSQIVAAARDYLREIGRRAPSGEIYKALRARGVEVKGKAPQKTTASHLSHSPFFDNVTGQGYGLVEWSAQPPGAGAESPQNEELSSAPKGNGALPLNL